MPLTTGCSADFRWQTLPDWQAVLFGPDGLRLDEWRADGRARVVKDGRHRAVYSVVLADRAFHVKHRRVVRFGDVARHLLVPSSARREWIKASELARRGVSTIEPVAWQEQVCRGLVWDSFLVTETIRGTCSLADYIRERLPQLPDGERRSMRRRIIDSLARFTASIHTAGVIHNDFHLGNILIRPDDTQTGGPVPLYLVDVPGVRFSGALGWTAACRSLIVLNSDRRDDTSRAERRRFLDIYLAERPKLDPPELRSAIEALELGTAAYSCKVARRRDRRALETNRDFTARRTAGRQFHSVADLDGSEIDRLVHDPEELLTSNLHRPLKLGGSSLVVEAELPVAAVYKRSRPRGLLKSMLSRFRRSKAEKSWMAGHSLLIRGIATPRPLAVCRICRGSQNGTAYLATERIEAAENLHLYGWRLAELPEAKRVTCANRCAESLGDLVGRMHAWGLTHGDLKGANVLVVENPAAVATYLIDVDDVRVGKHLDRRRQTADLARLATSIGAHRWVSRTTIVRFFRAYRRRFPMGRVNWKRLWREAARQSAKTTRQKRRRGEPLL